MGVNRVTKGGAAIGSLILSLGTVVKEKVVTLTNAEMLALRATPKTLVAAPASTKVLRLISAQIKLALTGGYTETADNAAIRYNNGSGIQVSDDIETTGLIDQTGTLYTAARPKLDPIATSAQCAGKALVLHNTGDGEWGGGNAANVVTVRILYAEVPA